MKLRVWLAERIGNSQWLCRVADRILPRGTFRRQWVLRLFLHLARPRHFLDASLVSKRASSKIDIVHFPIIPWDYRYQRPQQLCAMLGKNGHRVFYVNQLLGPSREPVKLRPLSHNVWELTLSVLSPFDIQTSTWSRSQIESFLASLDAAKRLLSIEAIGVVAFPTWGDIALAVRRRYGWKIAYDCMDEHSGFSNVDRARVGEEEELLRKSDLVIVTSSALRAKASGFRQSGVVTIPNGCDFQHFSTLPQNSLLDGLTKPIIGYYGAIADWFDCELIESIARQRTDWTFVLIGSTLYSDSHILRKLRNVHLLGEKPYSELPKYLYWFDVCLIPFKLNKLIQATNPVKFYEYLSSGKPVVSVKLPELLPYSDLCYIAEDRSDFLHKIEMALCERDPALVQRRIDFARENTWERRIQQLETEIERLKNTPLTPG